MPIFRIHHVTKYEYDRQVKESVNEIKVFPYRSPEQEILQHELLITGHPDVQVFFDYWGNKTGVFNLIPLHKELVIESKLMVRTTASSQLDINFHSGFDELANEINGNLRLLENAARDNIESQPEIDDIISSIYQPGKSVASVVESCSEYIFKHFQYKKGITDIESTVDDILVHRSGVCQDFAHILLQILRTLGIPSRYVSGYICPNKNGMRGAGATHAWIEAYIPGYGWAGIDPTNNIWITNKHVKLAIGRNFKDCSPVKGSFRGPANQKLSVFVSVGYEDGHTFEEINDVQIRGHQLQVYKEESSAQQQ
jgi:transglutaminase-like putative cysteine protease